MENKRETRGHGKKDRKKEMGHQVGRKRLGPSLGSLAVDGLQGFSASLDWGSSAWQTPACAPNSS